MKCKMVILCALILLLYLPVGVAAIEVGEAAIAAGISERTPVEVAESFPATIGRLYCFTRIAGAERETTVTHVWLYGGEEMARIELPVGAGDWRTWSSKRVLPDWNGAWRVDVLDAEGNVLKQLTFTIEGR